MMKPYPVYPLYPIEPVRAEGCYIYDKEGKQYLDLYGGHAVISIGHSHPRYVERINRQLQQIGFYSNSVENSLQTELADKLGRLSGYDDYGLFLCNSGAEANENALKLASFHTGRGKVLAFSKGFHGRTSAAVAVTDNPHIQAPVNKGHEVEILPLNDSVAVEKSLAAGGVAAVIVEGLQGIGGIHAPTVGFLQDLARLCKQAGSILILDEVQSGYGRTGGFFAHQAAGIRPGIITTAKGMGNGFPVGGVLISPALPASYGMLGTTFGGSHLACSAALAVLEVIEEEKLMDNARQVGTYLMDELQKIEGISQLRGRGLMIGMDMPYEVKELRKRLLFDYNVFTGVSGSHTIRLLPPLSLSLDQARHFIGKLKEALED